MRNRAARSGSVLAAAVLMLLTAAPSWAAITGLVAVKTAGNSPDEFSAGLLVSYQRESVISTTNLGVGLAWRVRYASITATDTGLLSGRTETLSSDYNVNFSVDAPGAYDLLITTSLNGAFTLVNDGGSATASGTAVSNSGGVLASGTLNLTSPGSLSGSGGGNTAFLRTASAVIQGSSYGASMPHSLRFTWTTTCNSPSSLTGGDECAVRLGLPATFSGQTAGAYPGLGARVQANDGHFVSIAFVSLCGNGTVEGPRGEQCDQGAANGTPTSCCTANCQFRAASEVCRPSVGQCDVDDFCSGGSATCGADNKSVALCRGTAGICDVAEFCDGVNNVCPTDDVQPTGTLCNAGSGDLCDPDEFCDGVDTQCPADSVSGAFVVCRTGSGDLCDLDEHCTGIADQPCPVDSVSGAFVECRASAGVCDPAENCTGNAGDACPADALEPSSTVCRPSGGMCDITDNCTGSSPACPADAKSTALCRSSAGVCDVADFCDGVNNACPVDAKASTATVCRPAADICDVAENCDNINDACPTDTLKPDGDMDGVCDEIDVCPVDADPMQVDSDADDLGDVCDPCTNTLPTIGDRGKATLQGLNGPAGTHSMKAQGRCSEYPGVMNLDPINEGLRLVVSDKDGNFILDATVPPGAYSNGTKSGWKVNSFPKGFTSDYRNKSANPPLGLERLKFVVKEGLGITKFQAIVKKGTLLVAPGQQPIKITLVTDLPVATTGECCEWTYTEVPPARPSCVFKGGSSKLLCK